MHTVPSLTEIPRNKLDHGLRWGTPFNVSQAAAAEMPAQAHFMLTDPSATKAQGRKYLIPHPEVHLPPAFQFSGRDAY